MKKKYPLRKEYKALFRMYRRYQLDMGGSQHTIHMLVRQLVRMIWCNIAPHHMQLMWHTTTGMVLSILALLKTLHLPQDGNLLGRGLDAVHIVKQWWVKVHVLFLTSPNHWLLHICQHTKI